jgi:hypothetical protein
MCTLFFISKQREKQNLVDQMAANIPQFVFALNSFMHAILILHHHSQVFTLHNFSKDLLPAFVVVDFVLCSV